MKKEILLATVLTFNVSASEELCGKHIDDMTVQEKKACSLKITASIKRTDKEIVALKALMAAKEARDKRIAKLEKEVADAEAEIERITAEQRARDERYSSVEDNYGRQNWCGNSPGFTGLFADFEEILATAHGYTKDNCMCILGVERYNDEKSSGVFSDGYTLPGFGKIKGY